ncbi:MAG TPA: hypothetical protein VFH97_06495, partial [Gemmatimonadales bacterium]|nr:hypothetical protein [Gemmatimonadales bacterium]
MRPADAETLDQLEFGRALEEVARRAAGPLGAARVRSRRPAADLEGVRVELRAVAELAGLLAGGDGFRPEPVDDIAALLERLGVPGVVLDGLELVALGRALEAMRLVRAELERVKELAPLTTALAAEPPPARLGRDLLRILDADGSVR